MSRLQSLGALSASLPRRGLLIGAASLAAAACRRTPMMTASHTPELDMARLDKDVGEIAARAAPAVLGFGLMNLESGQFWVRLGDRTFPMMSVFKLPLGAAAMAEVEAGRLDLSEVLTVTDKDLSPPLSPIADAWPGRTAYTAGEILAAALVDSDNTAADVLMKRIGGPGAVQGWLQLKDVEGIRIDRYEREIQPETYAMGSFRRAWKGDGFAAAMDTVPPARRRSATLAYMADPRDSATPQAMLGFLRRLYVGELLSKASTQRLLTLLQRTRSGADRIRAGLPPDAAFAHKPGTSGTDQGLTAAFNDVGIFTLRDHRSYAVAAFLTGSTASQAARAALFADLGRTAILSIG